MKMNQAHTNASLCKPQTGIRVPKTFLLAVIHRVLKQSVSGTAVEGDLPQTNTQSSRQF
jgi:hypothetical protein